MHSILESIRKSVRAMSAVHVPTGRRDFIRLDLNEATDLIDAAFLEIAKEFDAFTVNSYPEYEELYSELSSYTGLVHECICLSNGSDSAIELLLRLFFEKGDRVLLAEPTFFIYRHVLALLETEIVSAPIIEGEPGVAIFPTDTLLKTMDQSIRGLLLCSPNNPIGTSIPKHDLEALIEKAYELNIPVIIDEAYFEYSGTTAVSMLGAYTNVIVIRTFSKGFGLAGLRVGYVLADRTIISELIKLRLPWNVSHVSAYIATCALKERETFAEKRAALTRRKDVFEAFLSKMNITCYESHGDFLLAKVRNADSFIAGMKEKGILVGKPNAGASGFTILDNTVRLGIPSETDMTGVISTIRETLDQ